MSHNIQKIGVIGAGQMGVGIAQICATSKYDVYLIDETEESLGNGLERLTKNMDRDIARGRINEEERKEAIKRIVTGTAYEGFKDCDLIIEAASEDEDVKKNILRTLCKHINDNALIATNTSSISITRLAAQTDRPGSVCGMHFMNPVPRMELVELIRGIATEEKTYDAVRRVAENLGKTAVNAEDFPAFIVNRILLPMINEAIYTLYEGVGSVKAIDTAMKLGTNHPMGPLELADFIGLDTCLAIMHVLHDGLADTKYRPCPLLVKYVEAGWLGRKTNRGFYDYSGDEPVPTR